MGSTAGASHLVGLVSAFRSRICTQIVTGMISQHLKFMLFRNSHFCSLVEYGSIWNETSSYNGSIGMWRLGWAFHIDFQVGIDVVIRYLQLGIFANRMGLKRHLQLVWQMVVDVTLKDPESFCKKVCTSYQTCFCVSVSEMKSEPGWMKRGFSHDLYGNESRMPSRKKNASGRGISARGVVPIAYFLLRKVFETTWNKIYIEISWNGGSIFIGFSIINQPLWRSPLDLETSEILVFFIMGDSGTDPCFTDVYGCLSMYPLVN